VKGPSEFIGLAEETGLIVPLGLQVLADACRVLAVLRTALSAGFPQAGPPFVSVNLSPRQLGEPDIVGAIVTTLREAGANPRHFKLEVTESALMSDPDRAVTVLNQLKTEGFSIAIDDFGTGYSSLSYLQRFPIDTLKIDQSFVRDMLTDSADEKIVRAVSRLGKELGLAIVAEGVERPAEMAALTALGCDYAQGFLFSRPVGLAEAVELAGRRFV
jgi:EAL domain-containing protein (putative c-di-GMP-specific phosphodiesterase class I)